MTLLLILLSFIGLCVSYYAYTVGQALKKDPNYKPVCNISDRISCTKPIESPYGKLLGVSNSILGLIFYPIMALLAVVANDISLLIIASGLLLFTIYLAYILFVKVRSLCII